VKPVTSTKRHAPSSSWENTCMLSALAPRAWRPRSCHAAVRGTSASYTLPISTILSISQQNGPPAPRFPPQPRRFISEAGPKSSPPPRLDEFHPESASEEIPHCFGLLRFETVWEP
jgi:hypothetical protein